MHYKTSIKENAMQKYEYNANNANVIEKLYKRVKQNYGAINEIAKRRNCHRNWVSMVLKGQYEDMEVLRISLEVVQEYERKRENIAQQLMRALA